MNFKSLISVFYILLLSCDTYSVSWINTENIQTIYYQGMLSTQAQCAKYCGPQGMRATTGEKITCPGSIELIHAPFIGREISEIALKNDKDRRWYYPFSVLNTAQKLVGMLGDQRANLVIECDRNDGDEQISVAEYATNISKMNFGQEGDIAEHQSKMALCEKQFPGAAKILWGVSRGAATTFNAFARYHYQNVKLVVLEGCFDTVYHAISSRIPKLMNKFKFHELYHRLVARATAYRPDGISPLASVDGFPEGIPVVFITSEVDRKVAKECTLNLVAHLANRGKNDVYLLVLKSADHSSYSLGDGPDQKNYLHLIHAVYKRYGLGHVSEYAQQGEGLLARCLVTAENLR